MPRRVGGPEREPLRAQLEEERGSFSWSPQLLDIFWQDVKSLRKDEARKKVVQVLSQLFEGIAKHWEQANSAGGLWQRALGSTRIGDSAFILWWVELEADTGKQYLVVYRLVKSADLTEASARAERFLHLFSDEYLQASLARTKNSHGRIVPETCPILSIHREGIAEEVPGWRQRPVSLEKRYAVSERHLRILKDQAMMNIQLPYVLDKEEKSALDKVLHEPLFILGRSGTGKTTVQVHALYYLHRAERDFGCCGEDEDMPGPVLLVTLSPILARSIQKMFSRMCLEDEQLSAGREEELGVEEGDDEAEKGALPPSFLKNDMPQGRAPLITSWASFLLIADASVPSVQFFRPRQGSNVERALCRKQEVAGFDLQDEIGFEAFHARLEVRLVGNPPGSGILAKDDSLFVVYKEIITVIEGSLHAICSDMGYLSRKEYLSGLDSEGKGLPEMRDSTVKDEGTRSRVYDAFEAYLKFKREAGKFDRIDPVRHIVQRARKWKREERSKLRMFSAVFIDEVQDLVPAEILLLRLFCEHTRCWIFAGDTAQTISKGVEFRFESIKRLYFEQFLNGRDWYKAGPKASYDPCSVCGQDIRRRGGTLFECNSHIERHTKRVCGPGCYKIFEKQCADMMKGVGVSGRRKREWAEARGKLNCPVSMCALYLKESAIAVQEEAEEDDEDEDQDEAKRRLRSHPVPPIHHLIRNHRSHQGILDLAGSLIDALVRLFPDFVDKMPQEVAVGGAVNATHSRPVFLHGMSFDEAESVIFQRTENNNGLLEFGAKQAVLVWSEEARQVAKDRFKMSLVMTIHDCKGLEFSDVIILSPFSDMSTCQTNGQVLWTFLEACGSSRQVPPDFKPCVHGILCSWLKSLYVAVTGARERVWIFEEGEAGRPALTYWTTAGLVKCVSSVKQAREDPDLSSGFARTSTMEEFLAEAQRLLAEERFSQAAVLFARAEAGGHQIAKLWRQFAEASEKARLASLEEAAVAKRRRVEVGRALLCIARDVKALVPEERRTAPPHDRTLVAAAGSFLEALDFLAAAKAYEEMEVPRWSEAAKCWEAIPKWEQAGQAWRSADNAVAAMRAFHRGGFWKDFIAEAQKVKAAHLPEAKEMQKLATHMVRQVGSPLAKLGEQRAKQHADWELLWEGLLLLERGPHRDEVVRSLQMPSLGLRLMVQEGGSLDECAALSLQSMDWQAAENFFLQSAQPERVIHTRLLRFLRDLGFTPSQAEARETIQMHELRYLCENLDELLPADQADQRLLDRSVDFLCCWAWSQSTRDRFAALQDLVSEWSDTSKWPSGHALRLRILACTLACADHDHLDPHSSTLVSWLHAVGGDIQELLCGLEMPEQGGELAALFDLFLVEESPLLPQAHLVFDKLLCPNELDLSLHSAHLQPAAVATLRLLHLHIARLTLSVCQGLLEPMLPCWSHVVHGECNRGVHCRKRHDKTAESEQRASQGVINAFTAWHQLRKLSDAAGAAQAWIAAGKVAELLGVEKDNLHDLLRSSCTDLLLQVFLPPSAASAILPPNTSARVRQAAGSLIRAKLDELVQSLKAQERPPSLPELLPAPCALLLAPLVDFHGLAALSDVATERWHAAGRAREQHRHDSERAAWQLLLSFSAMQASQRSSANTGAVRAVNYDDLLNFFDLSHTVLAQAVKEQSVYPQAVCYLAERVVVWANILITQFTNTTLPESLVQTHLVGHGRLAALAAENSLPQHKRHVPFLSLQTVATDVKRVLGEQYTSWTNHHRVRFQDTTLRLLVILFSCGTINWFRSIRNTTIRKGGWTLKDRMSCMNGPEGPEARPFDPASSLPRLLQWLTLSLPCDESGKETRFDRMTPWFHSVMCDLGDPLCILHRRDTADSSPGWTRAQRPLSFPWDEFLPMRLTSSQPQDLSRLRPSKGQSGDMIHITWRPVREVMVYPPGAPSTRADGQAECDFEALHSEPKRDVQNPLPQDFVLDKAAYAGEAGDHETFVCNANEEAAAELLQTLNIKLSFVLRVRRWLRLARRRLVLKADPRLGQWLTERAWLQNCSAQADERLLYLFHVLPVLRHHTEQLLQFEELRHELRSYEDQTREGVQEAIHRAQDAIDELKILGEQFVLDHRRVRIQRTQGADCAVATYWDSRRALVEKLLPALVKLDLAHLWMSSRVRRGLQAWLKATRKWLAAKAIMMERAGEHE